MPVQFVDNIDEVTIATEIVANNNLSTNANKIVDNGSKIKSISVTFIGLFLCIINVFLFIRISWIGGQAGIGMYDKIFVKVMINKVLIRWCIHKKREREAFRGRAM